MLRLDLVDAPDHAGLPVGVVIGPGVLLGQLVDVNGVVVLDLALKKDWVGKFVRLCRDGCLSKDTKCSYIFCSVGQSQDMIIFHARRY